MDTCLAGKGTGRRKAALKKRSEDDRDDEINRLQADDEINRLQAKVGEIATENEILREHSRKAEAGLPLAQRRPRR